MKRILSLLMFLILAGTLVSCDSGNTGNFKISLKLPIDSDGNCHFLDDDADHTYCINANDQIMLSIYSKANLTDDYTIVDRKLIEVTNNFGGKSEFIRSLRSGNYYRFFVEVTNANEKLKLTGGIDGVYYDDSDNYEVAVFLGATADLVRVVGDRSDLNNDYDSLRSYFESSGSKGAAAVALKNDKLYLSGGYSVDYAKIMNKTMIFNMGKISSDEVKNLPAPLMDHAVALLDDGSETGIVIIAFGSNDDGNSNAIYAYNPEKDSYTTLSMEDNLTGAKAISIDGDVYIVGGCNGDTPSNKVYKVSKVQQADGRFPVTQMTTLQSGRCNQAIADISTTDTDGNIVPKILVIGGSTDQDGKKPLLTNFAEVVTTSGSTTVTVADRSGGDSSELLTRGLVSPAATTVRFDDMEEIEKVVSVVGGYFLDDDEDNASLVVNQSLFVFSQENENTWIYDVNDASKECARPSTAAIGTTEKSGAQYAVVNCGSNDADDRNNYQDLIVFVVQIKRSYSDELEKNIFSASLKESIMDNKDPDGGGTIIDGPLAVNSLGQVFTFGTSFVYQISSYSIPY